MQTYPFSPEQVAKLDDLERWVQEQQRTYPEAHLAWSRFAAEDLMAHHGDDTFDLLKEGIRQGIEFSQKERNQS